MKDCPYCANQIQDAAIKCQYCGERLDTPPPAATEAPARPRKKRRGHPLLLVYLVAGVGAFGASALYLAGHERTLGVAAAVGAAIVFVPVAAVAWAIGDVIRRFASPSAYFVSGGAMATAQTRVYWLIGPQSVAVFIVFAALGIGVLRASMPDMMDKAAATAVSSSLQSPSDQVAAAVASEAPQGQAPVSVEPVKEAAPEASSTVEPDAASSTPALPN